MQDISIRQGEELAKAAGGTLTSGPQAQVSVAPADTFAARFVPVMRPPAVPIKKASRWLNAKLALFLLIVLIPGIVYNYYLYFVASDQYVAEFDVGVRTADAVPSSDSQSSSIFSSSPTATTTVIGVQSYSVVQYMASRQMADRLQRQIGLRQLMSGPNIDVLSRLKANAPAEDFTSYWRNVIDPNFDLISGMIHVRVRAFTPQDALLLANSVVAFSQDFVLALSEQSRADIMRAARNDLDAAEKRVVQSRVTLREFRNREGVLDPMKTAESIQLAASNLRDDLAKLQTMQQSLTSSMTLDAPTMRVLEDKITATKNQLKNVEAQLASSAVGPSAPLSGVINGYETVIAQQGFAEKAYQAALQIYNDATVAADRQSFFLVPIVRPSLPEISLYPDRTRSSITMLVFALLIWAAVSITYQSIKDHAA